MKISIIGTRGIPNRYGGFEQFAEYLSVGLVERGHEVTVYNSQLHPFSDKEFKGVKIIHCKDPENKIGSAGQFIYDLNCILDARKRNFDIIFQLGYTSSSIWSILFPKKTLLITNMDGLEWKRTKYSKCVQKFLQFAERLAVKHSNHLISDSLGIQNYIQEKYALCSTYIPYGAHIFAEPNSDTIKEYDLKEYEYDLLIARLEPENNIETILDGVFQSNCSRPFLVIGNHETKFGEYLKQKFCLDKRIRFLGGVYNNYLLNNLRYFSNIYFHGHSVGGTNPSLLEAMGASALICAHDNIFNNTILGSDSFYFKTKNDIITYLNSTKKSQHIEFVKNNLDKINTIYNWQLIINQYENLFYTLLKKSYG
jgi:hypothetical protein